MVGKIYVVGIGPGTEDYLLPIARKKAAECDILVGGQRALDLFQALGKETCLIKAQLLPIVEHIKANRHKNIAVLVSGDPGFYSMLSFLKKHFSPEDLEVIPGISSMQMAFARLKEPWQNAVLGSLHGRGLQALDRMLANGSGQLGLLTDPQHSPREIVAYLKEQGIRFKKITVGQNLGYPNEVILETTADELLSNTGEFPNCVLVIEYEE